MHKGLFVLMVSFVFLIVCCGITSGERVGISDRELIERLIRLEEGQKGIQLQIDGLKGDISGLKGDISGLKGDISGLKEGISGLKGDIPGLKGDISDLKDFVLWGFGVMFAGMFALVGFVLWDRRTAIAPTIREVEELKRKEHVVEEVLRSYARKEVRFAEVMQAAGIL